MRARLHLTVPVLLAAALAGPAARRADALEVALYDPDANLSNVAELRSALAAYLRTIDPAARFQPFTRGTDLKTYLQQNRAQFLLLGHHIATELSELKLHPVLVPLRDGSTTYFKVLLVRKGTSPQAIRVIASTSTQAEINAIEVNGKRLGDSRVLVLHVSKGIDAVLGMAFNRADAAYVTPETVAQLASVDKDLAGSLEELYRSAPLQNPKLYAVAANAPDELVKRVVAAFLGMDKSPAGQSVLRILGYSGWRVP